MNDSPNLLYKRFCNNGAERGEREPCELEELHAERYAHDRDAPQQAESRVYYRHFQPAEEKPKHVDDKWKGSALIYDLFAERPERKPRELEALEADGYTEDRDAP